jgi:hypothetical protein
MKAMDQEAILTNMRRIIREELCATKRTPADMRMAAKLSFADISNSTAAHGIRVGQKLLRRFERGVVVDLEDPRIVRSMRALCEVFGVDLVEYRIAVRAQQEQAKRTGIWPPYRRASVEPVSA